MSKTRYDDLIRDSYIPKEKPVKRETRFDEIKSIDIKKKVMDDIVFPGILDFLSDMACSVIESFADVALETADILIYKEPRDHRRRGKRASDYHKAHDKAKSKSHKRRSAMDYNDVAFDTNDEAKRVKRKLERILESEDVITVADFYREADEDYTYADEAYGWTNIDNAYIMKSDGKYYIHMPRAKEL